MIDGSIVNAHCEAGIAAMAAGDWATAISELMQAWTALVAMPDSERLGNSIKWSRGEVGELLKSVRQHNAGSTGFQQTKVTYARPTT